LEILHQAVLGDEKKIENKENTFNKTLRETSVSFFVKQNFKQYLQTFFWKKQI
jgi:hypothetical protein